MYEKETILYGDVAGSTDYVISATNTGTGSPASNAGTNIVRNKVVSTGIGTWYLTFTNAVATKNKIKAVALLNLNTDNWDTIQVEASNDNFATAPAAIKTLTVKKRILKRYKENARKTIDSTRYDAYAFVDDWEYDDYRFKLDSTASGVTEYQIGRAYLAQGVYEIPKSPDKMEPGDVVTVNTVVSGQNGQNIMIPRYQQFNYTLNYKGITKSQADILTREVAVNPLCCYFCDGITEGELLAGTFAFQQRTVFGRTFGLDTIMLPGQFIESL